MKKVMVGLAVLGICTAVVFFWRSALKNRSIHAAAWNGNLGRVQKLVQQNLELLERKDEKRGMSPLHYAAWHGRNEIVTYLLSAGAHVNAADNTSSTPLMYAVASNHLKTTELLLAAGADVNARYIGGLTALHDASRYGYRDMVNLLIDYGADVNIQSFDESGGLFPIHSAVLGQQVAVTEVLLERGAMIDAKAAQGVTPLFTAIMVRNEDIVKLLLSRGADPTIKLADGKTMYSAAEEQKQVRILELLRQ